ncbi:MAG: hypothetical protein ABGY41_00615, partial [Candidatus Poribacteria bacterium]
MKRHVRHIGISVAAMLVAVALSREATGAPGIVWERVEGIYGAAVRQLVATEVGTLLAGTNEGLYRSEDRGESWTASG